MTRGDPRSQSFHFSPKLPAKDWKASEVAHEARIAALIGLKPGMRALDCGCGVGGPLRTIAAVSGAHVTGITINQYQVDRANYHNEKVGQDLGTCLKNVAVDCSRKDCLASCTTLYMHACPVLAVSLWIDTDQSQHAQALPIPDLCLIASYPYTELQQGVSPLTSIVRGDFLNMPFENNTFDAAYAIEATCHAPKVRNDGRLMLGLRGLGSNVN